MLADIPNYDQLSIAAKLKLVGEIWNDIAASNEPFPVEEWDRMQLEQRDKEMDADPSIALTFEEVWRQVDEKRG
jgi:putative addiction module component (TIGR02574 family)